MGRQLRTDVSQAPNMLRSTWPHLNCFKEKDRRYIIAMRYLVAMIKVSLFSSPIANTQEVWVNTQSRQEQGRIITITSTPRSYLIDTPLGRIRRNHAHTIPQPTEPPSEESEETWNTPRRVIRSYRQEPSYNLPTCCFDRTSFNTFHPSQDELSYILSRGGWKV